MHDSAPAAASSRYAQLDQQTLARLVPELLLDGHLIDRSGMAWCISHFGREQMTQISIEEWAGASPIYTRRMQQALGFAPQVPGRGDVVQIFKGLQLDIGAPPQFLDFRYTVHDPMSGEFSLAHCGALMDVEPMGEEYVRQMCHDVEDPTFDATAVATNPRAQVRPLHRPPRRREDIATDPRPHCAWTVIIDESHPPVEPLEPYHHMAATRAATVELTPIDPHEPGRGDYAGELLADIDFAEFSHSALVRLADEVCVQMHLLNLSYVLAVSIRANSQEQREEVCRKQLTGIAGLTAKRLADLLGVPRDARGALKVLELHPILNPAAYVSADVDHDDLTLRVRSSDAHADGAWVALCGLHATRPLDAIVQAVDPHLSVEVVGEAHDWTLTILTGDTAAAVHDEVSVASFSTGTDFAFEQRRSLPLHVL